MKTLIHVLPDKNAGVASVVRNLCRYQSGDFKTKVILLHEKDSEPKFRVTDNFNADKIVRLAYDSGRFGLKYTVLKKIQKEITFNSVLISHDGGIDLDVVKFFKLKIPVVYVMHGNYKHYYNVLNHKRESINQIITVSDYLKTKIENLYPNKKVTSIKAPVPDFPAPQKSKNAIIRLVFVGSLIKEKGIFLLPEIVKKLNKSGVEFSLNIIGEGPEKEHLQNIFLNEASVNLLGKLKNTEVLESHINHDIILLPSFNEGLPLVLVEAMKCGVVPLATDLPTGIPEIIENEVTGYQIPKNDIDGYSKYIEFLYRDRQKLAEMQVACIKKSNHMFNPIQQTRAYEQIFAKAEAVHVKMPLSKKVSYFLPNALVHRINKIKHHAFR